MSGFWSVSVFWICLVLFIAVALAFVLPPLLRRNVKSGAVDRQAVNVAIYRDQLQELEADLKGGELTEDQYQGARLEIEKRLSEDVPLGDGDGAGAPAEGGRWAGFAVAGLLPILAVSLYVVFGNPEAINLAHADAGSSHSAGAGAPQGEHDASAMLAALEAKLKKNPNDGAGWEMLGRTYGALGQYEKAAQAYAKVAALTPGDARVLADYAEMLALAQNKSFEGKPLELVSQALKINGKDEKALELAGIAAYQRQAYSLAVEYWRRLLALIPADSDYARDIGAAVQDAAAKAGGTPAKRQPAAEKSLAAGAAVSGTVSVDPALRGKFQAGDSVFIFAQKPGSKMPLAIQKIEAGQLPFHFVLDDTSAMASGEKLSAQAEVVVTARISKSGQATPQSGDLQGKSAAVKVGQQGVKVVIGSVIP